MQDAHESRTRGDSRASVSAVGRWGWGSFASLVPELGNESDTREAPEP